MEILKTHVVGIAYYGDIDYKVVVKLAEESPYGFYYIN